MDEDLEFARLAAPDMTYEWAKLLLARAHFNGSLAALDLAWQRVMAYGRGDFPATDAAELTICCDSRAPRRLRLHRRFDRRGQKIFIVAAARPTTG
jgi:hypothetical protein